MTQIFSSDRYLKVFGVLIRIGTNIQERNVYASFPNVTQNDWKANLARIVVSWHRTIDGFCIQ